MLNGSEAVMMCNDASQTALQSCIGSALSSGLVRWKGCKPSLQKRGAQGWLESTQRSLRYRCAHKLNGSLSPTTKGNRATFDVVTKSSSRDFTSCSLPT